MIKHFFLSLWTTAIFLIFFTLLFGVIYPIFVMMINQFIFPYQANGSLIYQGEQLKGSSLLGQHFSDTKYFWSRPSHTDLFPYNTAASAGSNLSPANPVLLYSVQLRIQTLKNSGINLGQPIPFDLVSASASGLDPHITLAAAHYQVERVARARDLDDSILTNLIKEHSEKRQFGFLGEPRINVVKLNLKLDEISLNNGNPTTRS